MKNVRNFVDCSQIALTGKKKTQVIADHVVLRGKVRSFAEKEDAERAAWCAAGISRVDNYLQVVSEKIFAF